MSSALRLDLGYSIGQYPTKMLPLILAALPWTIGLLIVATLLSFAVGSLLGALLAWPRAPRALRYLVPCLMALSAIPYYLLGLILVYVFALTIPVFPLSGGYTTGASPQLSLAFAADVARHALLPSLSIILAAIGGWALSMRAMTVTTEGGGGCRPSSWSSSCFSGCCCCRQVSTRSPIPGGDGALDVSREYV